MYFGDPEGVYDLPRAKRLMTIEYLLSEADPEIRQAAGAPISAIDLRRILIELGYAKASEMATEETKYVLTADMKKFRKELAESRKNARGRP